MVCVRAIHPAAVRLGVLGADHAAVGVAAVGERP